MADDRLLLDVADAIGSEQQVDWERCGADATGEQRRVVAKLRMLDDILSPPVGHRAAAPETERHERFAGRRTLKALLLVAGVEWAAALVVLPWIWDDYRRVYGSGATYLGVILIGYTACAAPLLLGGLRDGRAWLLGVYFTLMASIPAAHILPFALWGAAPDGAAAYAIYVYPFLFRPAVLWQFTREFPRVRRRSRLDGTARRMVLATALAGGAAGVLFACLHTLARRGSVTPDFLLAYQDASFACLTVLETAAIVALAFRARGAPADEFARVALFAGAFLIWSAGSAFYDVREAFTSGFFLSNIALTRFVLALAVVRFAAVGVMTYAVLARGALDVRFMVRASYRRLLARRVLALAAAAPAAGLAWQLATRPDRTVGAVLRDPWIGMLATVTAASLAAVICRRRLLRYLDAWVHPESAEQARLLGEAGAVLAAAAGTAEVGQLIAQSVRRACGAPATLLVAPAPSPRPPGVPAGFAATTATSPSLAHDSAIVHGLQATRRSVPVAADASGSVFDLLPDGDARWVAATGTALVVPVPGTGLENLGVIAVGRCIDDRLPSPFDTTFVELLAAAAGLALERLRQASAGSAAAGAAAADAEPAACECPACGRITAAEDGARCVCGSRVARAPVPARLAGAFRLERRLGAGGQGAVYLAWDEELQRRVAVKTLPSPSVDRLAQLRREALVMAAVSHPSIAQIYRLETWRGRPFLLVELLAGGTLADHLRTGPIPAAESTSIAVTVAGALEALHAEGYLHRDVKPSNIGFTSSGAAKLFDVGLACLMETDEPPASGTLPYLSPELLRGGAPGPADDVWALAVVLYEMVTGRHPFEAEDQRRMADCIRKQRMATPAGVDPAPEAAVAVVIAFATRFLTADPTRRIVTAGAFADALRALFATPRPAIET